MCIRDRGGGGGAGHAIGHKDAPDNEGDDEDGGDGKQRLIQAKLIALVFDADAGHKPWVHVMGVQAHGAALVTWFKGALIRAGGSRGVHEFLTRQRFVPALLDGSLIVLHRCKNRKCSA